MERRGLFAFIHGQDTPEFFEAIAAEGLSREGDEEKIRKLAEAKARRDAQEASSRLSTHVGSDGQGGMEVTISISRKSKEDGINAAIKSLGDRAGDDPATISSDLKKALRERDLRLDDDVRLGISCALTEGDEITVGINPTGGSN